MSETVAGTLIDVLEKIGVKQIFELIADSLNPWPPKLTAIPSPVLGCSDDETIRCTCPPETKILDLLDTRHNACKSGKDRLARTCFAALGLRPQDVGVIII